MVTKAELNKFTKDVLASICTENGVQIPPEKKTKADVIDFMLGFTSWPQPLDALVEAKAGATPKKSTAAKKTAAKPGVDEGQLKEIKDKIAAISADVEILKGKTPTSGGTITSNTSTHAPSGDFQKILDSQISAVKADSANKVSSVLNMVRNLEGEVQKLKTEIANVKANTSAKKEEVSGGVSTEQEMMILEGVTEEEFVPLFELFDFVEDLPKTKFMEIIKRLLFYRVLKGEEMGGDIQINMPDGSKIGAVKLRN